MKAQIKHFRKEVDLALTSLADKQIIERHSDPTMKARFQYIHEANVLDFDVEPYTDIDPNKLPFSSNDLQYLRGHFHVFFDRLLIQPH